MRRRQPSAVGLIKFQDTRAAVLEPWPPPSGGAETAPAFQRGQLPMLDRQIQRRAIRFSWKNPTPRFATPVAPKSGIILSQLVDHFGGGTPTNG
jgi:hypothetical protein